MGGIQVIQVPERLLIGLFTQVSNLWDSYEIFFSTVCKWFQTTKYPCVTNERLCQHVFTILLSYHRQIFSA